MEVELAAEVLRRHDASVYTEAHMPLNIRSENVNRPATKLASQAGLSKTEAVRIAPMNELRRRETAVPLADRLRPLLDEIAAVPRTGLEAGKVFYGTLNDD